MHGDDAPRPVPRGTDGTAHAPRKPVRLVRRPPPASATRIQVTPALENDPT